MVDEVPTELRTGVLKHDSSDNSWKFPSKTSKTLPADNLEKYKNVLQMSIKHLRMDICERTH